MGIVNKASKTMGVVGASLQSSGVALSFKNAYSNWNKKDKSKKVKTQIQSTGDEGDETENLLEKNGILN